MIKLSDSMTARTCNCSMMASLSPRDRRSSLNSLKPEGVNGGKVTDDDKDEEEDEDSAAASPFVAFHPSLINASMIILHIVWCALDCGVDIIVSVSGGEMKNLCQVSVSCRHSIVIGIESG